MTSELPSPKPLGHRHVVEVLNISPLVDELEV